MSLITVSNNSQFLFPRDIKYKSIVMNMKQKCDELKSRIGIWDYATLFLSIIFSQVSHTCLKPFSILSPTKKIVEAHETLLSTFDKLWNKSVSYWVKDKYEILSYIVWIFFFFYKCLVPVSNRSQFVSKKQQVIRQLWKGWNPKKQKVTN